MLIIPITFYDQYVNFGFVINHMAPGALNCFLILYIPANTILDHVQMIISFQFHVLSFSGDRSNLPLGAKKKEYQTPSKINYCPEEISHKGNDGMGNKMV